MNETNPPPTQAYIEADARDGDPEDHDPGYMSSDQCGWVTFGLILIMVLTLVGARLTQPKD